MSKIVVIDLDGCLCSINSFRFWLFFSFFYLFISFSWWRVAELIKCFFLRISKKINRVEMKVEILRHTEGLPSRMISLFCFFLNMFTNPKVVSLIEEYKTTELQLVLCTAAPDFYTRPYANRFGFSMVFATPDTSAPDWRENIGKAKLDALKSNFGEIELECVVTDHHDDLPLLSLSKRRVLVRPTNETLTVIEQLFEFDII